VIGRLGAASWRVTPRDRRNTNQDVGNPDTVYVSTTVDDAALAADRLAVCLAMAL